MMPKSPNQSYYKFIFISGYKMVEGKQVPITEAEAIELELEAKKHEVDFDDRCPVTGHKKHQ